MAEKLKIYDTPKLKDGRLVLGFSGWMDGGEVSTGAIKTLVRKLQTKKIAQIEPEGFYIYNFPGSMEITSLFRPHTRIKDGIVESLDMPSNAFYCSAEHNIVLFSGREPNVNWQQFADCIFTLCEQTGANQIYFVGSVAGLVPHTREPRLFCSVSSDQLKETLDHYGVKFSDYEGPASFVTYLTAAAAGHQLDMVNLVSTVPAYVQGPNPKCIEAAVRRLAGICQLHVDLDDLMVLSDEFEKKLSNVVQEQPELAGSVKKLEEDYDNEVFDNEMGDLKQWLHQKGIRLD